MNPNSISYLYVFFSSLSVMEFWTFFTVMPKMFSNYPKMVIVDATRSVAEASNNDI